jgi:hypothetical protein
VAVGAGGAAVAVAAVAAAALAVVAAAAGTSTSAQYAIYKCPRNLCYRCEISFHVSVLRRFFFFNVLLLR